MLLSVSSQGRLPLDVEVRKADFKPSTAATATVLVFPLHWLGAAILAAGALILLVAFARRRYRAQAAAAARAMSGIDGDGDGRQPL